MKRINSRARRTVPLVPRIDTNPSPRDPVSSLFSFTFDLASVLPAHGSPRKFTSDLQRPSPTITSNALSLVGNTPPPVENALHLQGPSTVER